jgi:hypothetical protein
VRGQGAFKADVVVRTNSGSQRFLAWFNRDLPAAGSVIAQQPQGHFMSMTRPLSGDNSILDIRGIGVRTVFSNLIK